MSFPAGEDNFIFNVYPYSPIPTSEHFIEGNDPFTTLGPSGTAMFFKKRWEETAKRKWKLCPSAKFMKSSSSRAYPNNYIKRMGETSEECRTKKIDPRNATQLN
ncbi:hypothetical protein COLO4_07425 [Corchorus olitorius]|uniref:Uncharacterized protein n=1 Tax=Corchorus olitorius TaxID=93759 RepID=A0A1R3KJT4_9ROSI|nr:hypothetical protein COLO4_07425 [Corchorus olitorius]